ncbi:MAG: DUF2288 domain-containing protein [Deltaproteobacteria bacterium]|nr:DUF2288 domain-containing protein [Deltaproteobacteria bacterium]
MTVQSLNEELSRKLAEEIGTVPWSWLRLHHQRGVLFLVADELELLEVALAVAEDRVDEIRNWLETGRLNQPRPEQVEEWENSGGLFAGVIVKPYVFFKPAEIG